MSSRRYQLLCPVARSLDVLGDRWTLLILRDLHAGPATFTDLQTGLGMASNLLSTRMRELSANELVTKSAAGEYTLTELGRSTDRVLWELVRFGSLMDRGTDLKHPGNHRTIALPLRMMLLAVEERPTLNVWLTVDGEPFSVIASPENVEVRLRKPDDDPDAVDLELETTYEGFLDLAERRINLDEFAKKHRTIVRGEANLEVFAKMMAEALDLAALGDDA